MRLTEHVERVIVETLSGATLGESYDHEVMLTFQPGPQGPVPSIAILIVGRGVALDEVITAAPILIPSPKPAADVIKTSVRQAVAAIQAERARQSREIPMLGVPR